MNETPWALSYATRAARDIDRLDPQVRSRVLKALRRLAADDPTIDVRKLRSLNEWRMRVGDWRVRFVRDRETKTIHVTHVLPRGRAHDR